MGDNLAVLEEGQRRLEKRLRAIRCKVRTGVDPRRKSLVDIVGPNARTVRVAAKTCNGGTWQFDLKHFLDIEYNEATGTQRIVGDVAPEKPEQLIILIWLGDRVPKCDRYFVLSWRDLQICVRKNHTWYLNQHGGRRPNTAASTHTRVEVGHLPQHEDKWERLQSAMGLEAATPISGDV